MSASKVSRYSMFALLYFTQGTILSYFTSLNALYFLSRGVSMTRVGIFSTIALLPFVLKIFLGILSDRVNLFNIGHRKPYILLGLAIQFTCLVIAPFLDPNSMYWGFVALAFILQMGMALYDTCTDGLALDTVPDTERGFIQGLMVGGRAVGVIVTASVVGLLAEKASWYAVFWLLAILTLLPLPFVLKTHESERPASQRFNWKAFSAFKSWTIAGVVWIGLISFLVIVGANQLVNPYFEQVLGISLSTAGFITTVWGIGVVVGGLGGGRLSDRIGWRNAVLLSLSVSTLSLLVLGFGVSQNTPLGLAFVFALLFGIGYGTYQAVYFALAMRFTVASIAASMFAILMAFTNVGQGIGLSLGGMLADRIDYGPTMLVFAVINLLVLPILFLLKSREKTIKEII